jgi:hypothetical protein
MISRRGSEALVGLKRGRGAIFGRVFDEMMAVDVN